jgi:hypothetical protein
VGPAGPAGAAGATGSQGPAGPKGDTGAAGPAGPGLDQDWAVIKAISWTHNDTVNPAQAFARLAALKCNLTKSIHPDLVTAQPQICQVWFEPAVAVTTAGAVAPAILTFEGKLQFTPQTLTWAISIDQGSVTKMIAAGGRVLVRIHCGTIFDTNKRTFSAGLDLILGATSLRLPGGVFESWFFVKAG